MEFINENLLIDRYLSSSCSVLISCLILAVVVTINLLSGYQFKHGDQWRFAWTIWSFCTSYFTLLTNSCDHDPIILSIYSRTGGSDVTCMRLLRWCLVTKMNTNLPLSARIIWRYIDFDILWSINAWIPSLQYRKIVLEWIIGLCDYFGLHPTTTFAAIAYLDRLQPNEKYSRFEWQMLAICCILISCRI